VKIGIVVQRYGADISGGAELHARYIAERLARHVPVEVLTTCATDYITWRNSLATGSEVVNGVPVRRFPVLRERDPDEFGRHSRRVFATTHSLGDELAWLDAEGPTSPALIEHIGAHASEFDFFIFFSFRYYHAYHGIRAVASKAILVPTAERDGALGLSIFGSVFRSVRAVMYNSFEERALINAVANNSNVPGVVVGVGSDIPAQSSAIRFRQKFNMRDRFAIYIGRIDENKGCAELFDYFQRYARMLVEGLHLVLIGHPVIPIPEHPRIHHLGHVSDQDKFDALAAAELLIMPSYFESLSMVALEAWALGKPVLANGQCDVLKGQCIRSNGGLYYDNFAEFIETLRAIDFNPTLATALARNGRDYFARHYAWPVIERKYLDMVERLKREQPTTTIEPLPGWFARRRKSLPPAEEIVATLPRGAVLKDGSIAAPAETRPAPQPIASTPVSQPATRPDVPVRSERPERVERTDRPRHGDRRPQQRGRHQRPRRPGGRPPRRSGNR
jgi:glycosyltransferase involved in cell wall biosynthesis